MYILQGTDTDLIDDETTETTFQVYAISNDISTLRSHLCEILQMTDEELNGHWDNKEKTELFIGCAASYTIFEILEVPYI